LDKATKHRLGLLIADRSTPGAVITVAADSVVCRAGNVDIAVFSCALKFGGKTVNLSGRAAHEVFATLAENGVPGDGAAGTIYEAVHALNCTLDPAAIAQKDGGGASCSFIAGPE
jgi:hypothetical protein